jgi:phospholipid/cholesterol/gamma-HCH transport system substrate-binding protein
VRRSWAAITVGILALTGLAISGAIFAITTKRGGTGKSIAVYALFRDARGLADKTRVLSAGLPVGEVVNKTLDPVTQRKARVNLRLYADKIIVYENAMAQKKVESLLGAYYLDIDPGSPIGEKNGKQVRMRVLGNGDEIKLVTEPAEMGEILDQVSTTLPILKEILADVRDLTSGQVKDIADNVNEMISKNSVVLERLLGRVDNIAASVESVTTSREEDIKVSLRNVREITEGIKSLVGSSEGQVNETGKQLRSSIDKLQSSVISLEATMHNAEKITGKIADGEGTVGKLLNDPAIANNVEQITEDVGGFVRGLTRLQTIVGLRTEYNHLAHTFKSYFQITLAPRPDKYYLIEIVDDPRGLREQRLETRDSSALGPSSEVVVTTSQKLRFSFMFGKCLGILCLRFGIKETTGGLGADLHLFNGRLTLSTDVFDTQSNSHVRVQGRAILSLYKRYVSVVAGIDDPLNYRPRGGAGGFLDFFYGLQVQFNDEDLKSVLLFGGSALSSAAK